MNSPWKRSFFVTLVFVTLAAGLFWLDSFRTYQADVTVLIIGKSQAVAVSPVAESFVDLSHNLSFYERLLSEHDLIDDDFAGLTKDERKASWNAAVAVKHTSAGGTLTVTATKETPEKAKLLAEATTQTLFSAAGLYYDIKNDIDMRVVDGAIIKTTLKNPVRFFAASAASGLLVTSIFFWLLFILPTFFGKKRVVVNRVVVETEPIRDLAPKVESPSIIGESVPYIDPRKFIPTRPTTLTFSSPAETASAEKKMPQATFENTAKAAAPANLPVAPAHRDLPIMTMADLPFQFEERLDEKDEAVEEKTVKPVEEFVSKSLEPTVEEYKRRLNELLAGGK